jgi:hypothetical protein
MEKSQEVQKILHQVASHELDPHTAAQGLVHDLFGQPVN